MQGLPKSHVGPKGYRHVNISAITYEPHCEPCHTTIANRWRHRIGNITNTNIFVFKQSGLKDVYNTLFFFFFSPYKYSHPFTLTSSHFFPYCCKMQRSSAGCLHSEAAQCLTVSKSPFPLGPKHCSTGGGN